MVASLVETCLHAIAVSLLPHPAPWPATLPALSVPEPEHARSVWQQLLHQASRLALAGNNTDSHPLLFFSFRQFAPLWQPVNLTINCSNLAAPHLAALQLVDCQSLVHLELRGPLLTHNNAPDSLPLPRLTSLRCLSLAGCDSIDSASLTILTACHSLAALDLHGLPRVNDDAAHTLCQLTGLRAVDLGRTSITDITVEALTYGARLHSWHQSQSTAVNSPVNSQPAGNQASLHYPHLHSQQQPPCHTPQPTVHPPQPAWPVIHITDWRLRGTHVTATTASYLLPLPALTLLDTRATQLRRPALRPLEDKFHLTLVQPGLLTSSNALAAAAAAPRHRPPCCCPHSPTTHPSTHHGLPPSAARASHPPWYPAWESEGIHALLHAYSHFMTFYQQHHLPPGSRPPGNLFSIPVPPEPGPPPAGPPSLAAALGLGHVHPSREQRCAAPYLQPRPTGPAYFQQRGRQLHQGRPQQRHHGWAPQQRQEGQEQQQRR